MKLSRRCFLSFVVGGAAGTALSPLPFKLADDFAIWSQNWTWTPVPPDGEVSYEDSTCTLCPGGCGISVRKVNDRAVKIEGRQGHPLNEGGVCILGLSGLQLLYSPSRIKGPLKRVGKRGGGQWQPVSWSQAIDETVSRLKEIRDQGSPQTVAALMPRADGTVSQLTRRLLTAYGSPNFMTMPSVDEIQSSVLNLTRGTGGVFGSDVAGSDFILSFGSALLDGYGSPVQVFQAMSRLKETHGKLVQVEHRLSNTAAKADEWLAAAPGSEGDLALAMAQVIISSRRYNSAFISGATEGFVDFARLVNTHFTPEKVSGVCGIDAERIKKTALAFAGASRPLALYGKGKGQAPGSLKEALAVNTLNALVGNINSPGGVRAVQLNHYIQWPEVILDDTAKAGLGTPRADDAGSQTYPYAANLVHRFIDNVSSGSADIQALLVGEANPCYSLPDPGSVRAAFDKIPFVVSFSSFMDETAAQADIILPNHIYLERFEDVPVAASGAAALVGLCRPVTAPLYDTQHMGDTLIRIAQNMGGPVGKALQWSDYETCLQSTLADQWRKIKSLGYINIGEGSSSAADGKFKTPSGKFTMMNDTLSSIFLGVDAQIPGDATKYPLVLIPYDSIRLASRYIADPPFLMKTVPDTVLKKNEGWVEINPDSAAEKGIAEGQLAVLKTPVGKSHVRVHYNIGLMPGYLAMARGLGHNAYDEFLIEKGTNINDLMKSVEDPASGMDAAWGVRAELSKA